MKKKTAKGKKKGTSSKARVVKAKKCKVKTRAKSAKKTPQASKTKLVDSPSIGKASAAKVVSELKKVEIASEVEKEGQSSFEPEKAKSINPPTLETKTIQNKQQPVVEEPCVAFDRPQVIIYRFLHVLVERNRLVFDLMRYSKYNLYGFLVENWNSPELVALIDLVRLESYYDSCQNEDTPVVFRTSQSTAAIQDSIVMYVNWKCYRSSNTMDLGHDNPALRALLHLVMLDGFITGRLSIHIEPWVVEAIQRLGANGQVKQYVYSRSLTPLFDELRMISFTDVGDLASLFDGFFDGLELDMRKKETYQTMASAFEVPSSSILFVTLSETESKKAARAGMFVAKIREQRQKAPKYYTIKVITNICSIRFQEPTRPAASGPSQQTQAKE